MIRRLFQIPFLYLWLFTLFLILVPYILIDIYGSPFAQDYFSNLLATYTGVIIGIPVALWLSNYQERRIEKEMKKKILLALYEELMEDVGYLSKWKNDNIELRIKRTINLSALLKDDLWRAFSDGGELKWINDPNLLLDFSAGYSKIVSVKYLADKYYELRLM